jgi:hypothetical protein
MRVGVRVLSGSVQRKVGAYIHPTSFVSLCGHEALRCSPNAYAVSRDHGRDKEVERHTPSDLETKLQRVSSSAMGMGIVGCSQLDVEFEDSLKTGCVLQPDPFIEDTVVYSTCGLKRLGHPIYRL